MLPKGVYLKTSSEKDAWLPFLCGFQIIVIFQIHFAVLW